ncbi:YjdF family protein [uncultured Oscillibacter sp.]|uniref:YjdF family protein n=1 Tax=uncultured Oscillibacter sp. TaxID=876091 RepID=UPI0025F7F453|nr:YjdF family protein [uncultured Oscillibacter sp.]
METGYARLTVYFEDPFWVGLFERGGGGTWEACKVTFGPEPKDHEVYAFLLENHRRLQFSPAIAGQPPAAAAANPKRRQRQIKRQLERPGCGTKAQQALAAQQEQGREAKKHRTREEREAEQARQFALRREKRREKHRGH